MRKKLTRHPPWLYYQSVLQTQHPWQWPQVLGETPNKVTCVWPGSSAASGRRPRIAPSFLSGKLSSSASARGASSMWRKSPCYPGWGGSVSNQHWSRPSRMTSMLPTLSDWYPHNSIFKRHLPRLLVACCTLQKSEPSCSDQSWCTKLPAFEKNFRRESSP